MKLYVEDLLREIDILNWYSGEGTKRMDGNADLVQTGGDQQDALMYNMRKVVTDVLLLANTNRVKFTCEYDDDALNFSLSPLRAGKEYMLDILKEAIRQYLVYEVRRLWMMTVRPEWADSTLREGMRLSIMDAISTATSMGERVRRRATTMGI